MTASALEVYDAGLLRAAGHGDAASWRLRYADGSHTPLDLRAWCNPRPGDNELLAAARDSVLDIGSVPLPVLEEHINGFIAEQKAKAEKS